MANAARWRWTSFLYAMLAVLIATFPAHAQPHAATGTDVQPVPRTIAITDVNVIDIEHGRVLGPRTVVIRGGRIAAVSEPQIAAIPPGALRVDGRGKFLIPGLVDMHVHLFNLSSRRPPNDWAFPLFVANGVTAVREMRSDAAGIAQIRQWHAARESGTLIAPRILAAGIVAHGQSPEDAVRQVNAATEAGAGFIKVFSGVPEANWRAILSAAQARSLIVAGHVPAGVGVVTAATAGQRSNEHLLQVYEACTTTENDWLAARRDLRSDALEAARDKQESAVLNTFDVAACKRTATALAATGQTQVPTLVLDNEDAFATTGKPAADPRWQSLRADERERWQRFIAGYRASDAALAKRRIPVARQIVGALHAAGVPILAGTDTPMPGVYPGYSLHEELTLLVEAGLSPAEALKAATLRPAQFLGIAMESGSVDAGKRADLVLLDADPLLDIRNTRRIHAVVLDGRFLSRRDIDGLIPAGLTRKH